MIYIFTAFAFLLNLAAIALVMVLALLVGVDGVWNVALATVGSMVAWGYAGKIYNDAC